MAARHASTAAVDERRPSQMTCSMIFAMSPGYANGRSVGSAARLLGEVRT